MQEDTSHPNPGTSAHPTPPSTDHRQSAVRAEGEVGPLGRELPGSQESTMNPEIREVGNFLTVRLQTLSQQRQAVSLKQWVSMSGPSTSICQKWIHPRPTESETLQVASSNSFSTNASDDSDTHSRLRATGSEATE